MPAAYQDQDGKWWKECSSTKQLFGGVDTKEELEEWFSKHSGAKDGFRSYCKEIQKEKGKVYRQENPEKIKESRKLCYQKNPEKAKERDRLRYQKSSEKIKESRKLYYQKNSEKIKESKKLYRQQNLQKIKESRKLYRQTPAGMFVKYKNSAKERDINFTLTLEWFEEQTTKPEFNVCYFSGIKFDERNHPHLRSLDRISSTKGYTPDNVRWVCYKFNSWKGDLTLNEIAVMFKAMANHHNVDPFEILKKVA